jgi:Ca2+-binding RTX toxin-like protein
LDPLEPRRLLAYTLQATALDSPYVTNSGEQTSVQMDYNPTAGVGVIVWADYNGFAGGAQRDVIARRFNSSGAFLGSAFRVNTNFATDATEPVVAVNNDGSFLVAWNRGTGLAATRLFKSTGVAAANQVDHDLPLLCSVGGLATNGAGKYVLSFTVDKGAGNFDIQAQRFTSSGGKNGGAINVNFTTAQGQFNSSVGVDSGGNFVVAWESAHQDVVGTRGVYFQRFGASGGKWGGETRANVTTAGNQIRPSVDMDAAGNYVVAWSGNGIGDTNGIFHRRYNNAGEAVSGELLASPADRVDNVQDSPSVMLLASGRYAISWYDRTAERVESGLFDKGLSLGTASSLAATQSGGMRVAALSETRTLVAHDAGIRIGLSTAAPGRVFTVNGTAGDDTVEVLLEGSSLTQSSNGVSQSYPASAFDKIVVRTGDGADTVRISGVTGDSIDVDSGAGNDVVTLPTTLATNLGLTVTVNAGDGDNLVSGSNLADTIVTGTGIDTIFANDGDDVVQAGEGNDLIYGGAGNDTLSGNAGNDRVWGGNGDDRLGGNGGADKLYGEAGNDRLYGDAGNDYTEGGAHTNRIWGGEGDDTLVGGANLDRLYGEAGDDVLNGGKGADTLDGGEGNDTAYDDASDVRIAITVLL